MDGSNSRRQPRPAGEKCGLMRTRDRRRGKNPQLPRLTLPRPVARVQGKRTASGDDVMADEIGDTVCELVCRFVVKPLGAADGA